MGRHDAPNPRPDPHHRRRPRRLRGRLAGGEHGRARRPARDAPRRRHLRPPDRRAGRARLLELLPLRRRRAERRRTAALGDARRRRPRHRHAPTATACPPAARSPSTASRSPPRSPPASRRTRSSPSSAARSPACPPPTGRASSSPPARSPRRRWPRRSAPSPTRARSPSSTPSRPIVHFEIVDLSKAWFQSRYDKGETEAERTAYLNCPMDRDQYEAFIDALLAAEKTEFKDWEQDTPYFEGCLPIEVMAERGRETLRYGPMKPVGLTNPHAPDVKPHAVVQLRRDNALGTLYNLVGFQTKMKHGAQTEVFRIIPGLENAALRPARRHPPQHLPQLPPPARRRDAPQGRPAPALRRPDHRRRGLRRERGHGPARRPPRRRRAPRPPARPAARDHRDGRAAPPHHRRRRRRRPSSR